MHKIFPSFLLLFLISFLLSFLQKLYSTITSLYNKLVTLLYNNLVRRLSNENAALTIIWKYEWSKFIYKKSRRKCIEWNTGQFLPAISHLGWLSDCLHHLLLSPSPLAFSCVMKLDGLNELCMLTSNSHHTIGADLDEPTREARRFELA